MRGPITHIVKNIVLLLTFVVWTDVLYAQCITTFAGNGTLGNNGDGGLATAAQLQWSESMAFDASGNMYVADMGNNRIRKIAAGTGIISAYAGTGAAGYTGDGGAATSATLNYCMGIDLDAAGNVYIADANNNCIRKVAAGTGIISTFKTGLNYPSAIAIDKAAGIMYICACYEFRIYKVIIATGVTTVYAGTGVQGDTGDGGAATSAKLDYPGDIAVDLTGNLYLNIGNRNRIRKVTLSTGIISAFAGTGTAGFSGDGGAATSAKLNAVDGVGVDAIGNVYIGDYFNNRIRKVAAGTGIITTVAGTGTAGYNGDDIPALTAQLYNPSRVDCDAYGNLYISDQLNYRIRKVSIAAPIITSFTPTTGPAGTTVTITGAGFNTTPSNNIVFFGAVKATISAATYTSLTVTAPLGANYQYIYVTNLCNNTTAYSSKPFIITYGCGTASFAAKVDFTTGTSPYLVPISDLDGDGKPDLATANASTNNVSVLRNTSTSGNISFATKVDFATGGTALGVATGDFDGDGKPDLAVTNQAAATVSVLRNTCVSGTISFAAKVDFTVGTTTSYLFIGDLDGDGKPDIAIANQGAGTVSVLRNTSSGSGNISFAPKVDYAVGASPNFDFIGDLDGDGKPDLAVNNVGSASISTFRNISTPGTISFAAKVDFATGTTPYGLAMSDLDGDNKPDLLTVNWVDNNVSALRNTSTSGTISFAARVNFVVTGTPHGISVGDMDGDGKPDVAVTNTTPSNKISTLINTSTPGTISFAAKVDYVVTNNPYGVSTCDLDGDGKLDIASSNTSSNTISILRNIGNSSSMSFVSFSPSSGPIGTTVTITGSGFNTTASNNVVFFGATKATVISATSTTLTVTVNVGANYQYITVTNLGTNLTVYSVKPFLVTFGCGAAAFAPKVDISGGAMSVETSDVDGDRLPDLILPDYFNNLVSVSRNTSVPGTISFAAKVDFATNVQPNDVALGDLDGDGKPDMAVVHTGAASVSTWRNTSTPGSITFAAKVDFGAGTQPDGVKIIDFDGDGKPDIVSANWGSNNVSVLKNTSTVGIISFAAAVNFVTGVYPNKLDVGDLDGDCKPDIAVTNWNSSSVSILRNTCSCGTISFAAKVDYATGAVPEYVHIGDLDGDGKPDLALASRNINTVSTYRNLSTPGTISFAAKVDFATGAYPYGVAIGDLNGDGKPDLAVANYTPYSVSKFINLSTPGTINFAAKVDYTTGAGVAYDVGINDLDGDGISDLAASKSNNTISIFRTTCIALPIELLSFKANREENDVLLQWSTASETNNDYFTIERRNDTSDFRIIGKIKGAGNSNSILNYSFIDNLPYTGINYYRLKQTDYDGQFSYSQIETVVYRTDDLNLIIYPVPANASLNYQVTLLEDSFLDISVIDLLGNILISENLLLTVGVNARQIDISKLSNEIYFIQFRNGAKHTQLKFVKE